MCSHCQVDCYACIDAFADNDFDPEESAAYQAIMSKCLSNFIGSNEASSTWDLRRFALGDADMATIVKGLEGNTTVEKLDLSDHRFTEAGLQELAKMMEKNSTITSVDFTGSGGADEEDSTASGGEDEAESAACKDSAAVQAIQLKCRQNLLAKVSCEIVFVPVCHAAIPRGNQSAFPTLRNFAHPPSRARFLKARMAVCWVSVCGFDDA